MEEGIERSHILRGIKKTPEEAHAALTILFQEQLPLAIPTKTLMVATGSNTKYAIIENILKPLGITVLLPDDYISIPEEEYAKILQGLQTPGFKYAPRMSARKLIPFIKKIESGTPTIALDTVVTGEDDQVFEKPQTLDQARQFIKQMTAGRHGNAPLITIIDGVTLAARTEDGSNLYWRTSAYVTVCLRPVAEQEIEEYLRSEGDAVFTRAGGIDFSTPSGQKFIDGDTPVPYGIGKGSTGTISNPEGTISDQQNTSPTYVMLSKSASSVVYPYFQGVPTHLVRSLFAPQATRSIPAQHDRKTAIG